MTTSSQPPPPLRPPRNPPRRANRFPKVRTGRRRLSTASKFAVRARRLLWRGRAQSWDEEGSQPLTKVVERVLQRSQTTPETVAVDLGCGSGQVTLPLARRCATVLAVDVSEEMIELLREKAAAQKIGNLQPMTSPVESLELDPDSIDLVTSNYALHHLRDADKRELVERIRSWLRPGGQLVIGDMMLGRGGSSRDRQLIATKIRHMAARGPAGWWRILKNLWRFSLRVSEKPLTPAAWEELVGQAGFEQVRVERVVQEACVLSARKPAPPTP